MATATVLQYQPRHFVLGIPVTIHQKVTDGYAVKTRSTFGLETLTLNTTLLAQLWVRFQTLRTRLAAAQGQVDFPTKLDLAALEDLAPSIHSRGAGVILVSRTQNPMKTLAKDTILGAKYVAVEYRDTPRPDGVDTQTARVSIQIIFDM